jgi:HEAT repeat protein
MRAGATGGAAVLIRAVSALLRDIEQGHEDIVSILLNVWLEVDVDRVQVAMQPAGDKGVQLAAPPASLSFPSVNLCDRMLQRTLDALLS